MTDLAEEQFQFSTRSHQKEGSAFKSPQRPSAAAASASVPDTSRYTESEMEISIASESLPAPVLSDDSLQSRLPPLLQIQS